MNSTGALYQWEGAGTPPASCILEGSANIIAASAAPGRQLTSEPPMQLWGAAEKKINMSKDLKYRYSLGLGGSPTIHAISRMHRVRSCAQAFEST